MAERAGHVSLFSKAYRRESPSGNPRVVELATALRAGQTGPLDEPPASLRPISVDGEGVLSDPDPYEDHHEDHDGDEGFEGDHVRFRFGFVGDLETREAPTSHS